MFRYLKRRAQSTAEYVIILGLIIGAVVAMQTYIKRGMQGRIKSAVDTAPNESTQTVFDLSADQYEPYYLRSSFNTTSESEKTENLKTAGAVDRKLSKEETNRTGDQWIDLGIADNEKGEEGSGGNGS